MPKTAKGKDPVWIARVAHAYTREADVRASAERVGITLRVSEVDFKGTKFPHWMFNLNETRLLNYYPSKGSYNSPAQNSSKGTCDSPEAALELAKSIARKIEAENG